jgi:prophage DNA circulation protein
LSEKYLRELIGKAEIEDALKRLDKLTNEEVRMVIAQVLNATHIVDDRVVRVNDRVARVDEGVNRIDDRVAHVDEGVARVEGRVASVDNRVKAIDDKVAAGIDGAQLSFFSHQETMFNPDVLRGERDKGCRTTSGRQHGSSQKFVIFLR